MPYKRSLNPSVERRRRQQAKKKRLARMENNSLLPSTSLQEEHTQQPSTSEPIPQPSTTEPIPEPSASANHNSSQDKLAEFQDMIQIFRVVDLHKVLQFLNQSVAGRKHELQQRVLDLLKGNFELVSAKLREIYRTDYYSDRNTQYGPPDPKRMFSHMQMPTVQSTADVRSAMVSVGNVGGPGVNTNPGNGGAGAVPGTMGVPFQHAIASMPIHPDVRLKKLAFYDVLATLIKPSSLLPRTNQRIQELPFYFTLTPQQATEIATNRDIRNGSKVEHSIQVQLRFCLLETSCEQEDCFPSNVIVKVNNKLCPLPNPIPTNRPNVEPKRPPRPVNVTSNVKLSPTVTNTVTVQWCPDFSRGYCIAAYLVKKLTSSQLLHRMKTKGIKPADYTRGLIKEKLTEDADCEIATTMLKVSLNCPLGKMKMSIPCRASTCSHLQCFDANLYLQMNERKPTWNCPVCDKAAIYDHLVIDGYFQEVLASSLLGSEDTEIQLHKDGSWSTHNLRNETQLVDTPSKPVEKVELISDDIELITDDVKPLAAKSAPPPPVISNEPTSTTNSETVDLTLSDSDDDMPLAKRKTATSKNAAASAAAVSTSNGQRSATAQSKGVFEMSMSVAEKYCLRVQAAKDAREEKHELRRKKRMAIEERLRKIREQGRKLRTQANKNPISSRALMTPDVDFSKSPTQSENDSDDYVDPLSSNSNDDQSNQSNNESAPLSDPVEKVANSTEERRYPMVIRLMERIRQHREKQKKLKTMSSSLRNSIEQIGPSDNVDSSKPMEVETSEQNSNQSGNSSSTTIEMEQELLEPVSSLHSNMEVERQEENSSKPELDNERCQNLKLRKKPPHPSAEAQKQEVAMNSSSLDSTDKDKKDQLKSNSHVEQASEDMQVEMLEKNSFDNECLSKGMSLRNVHSSTFSSRDLEEESLEQNSPHDELVESTKHKRSSINTSTEAQKHNETVKKTMTSLNRCIYYTKPGHQLESEAVVTTPPGPQKQEEPVQKAMTVLNRCIVYTKPGPVYTKEVENPKPITKSQPSSSLGPVLDMNSIISGPSVEAFLNDTNDSKSSKVSSPIVDQLRSTNSAVDVKSKMPEQVSSESDMKPVKTKGEKIRDFFLRIKEKVKQQQQNGEIITNQNPSSSKTLITSDSEMCEAFPESQIESLNVTTKLDPSKSSKTSKSFADQNKVLMSGSTSSAIDDGKVQKPILQNPPQADGWRPIPNAKKCGKRYKKRMAFLAAMTPDLPIAEQYKERYKKRMKEPPKETANCSTTNTNVKLHDLFSRINPTKYTETEEKGQILNSKSLTCSDSIVSNNSTGEQNNKSISESTSAAIEYLDKKSPDSGQVPNANNKPNNWEKPMPTAEEYRKQTNTLKHSKFPKADILRRNTNVKLQDLFSRINDTKSTNDAELIPKACVRYTQEIQNHPLRKKARVETDTNSK
ncbi:uncharacterized protein LOC129921308 isoform X2 [Episyrphus balteatus]|uniref:uncharacterized protein LOC129921308 isoform X2 n=1 Tax=Episyrphus balteatus TaxID=286459 RepID=UPI002485366B|nr:uncharacterized protein LOC129921308 isoform X2 [Episyrphus balteatus]